VEREWPEVIRSLLSSKRRPKFEIREGLRGNKILVTGLEEIRIKVLNMLARDNKYLPDLSTGIEIRISTVT
jgi:hypothetical protein